MNDLAPRVIVGVDPRLTEGTEDALALARVLSTATGAQLHLLCAYPWSAMAVEDEDMLRAGAERALVRGRELLGAAGVTDEAVPSREPAGALHEAAARAALLIVGSSHRGPVGHALAGDVAQRVLHHAPCPVAVAPHGYSRAEQRLAAIGIAFTDTPAGRAALRIGDELAARAGAALRVIAVADPADLSIGRVLPEHERRELLLHELVARELDAAMEQRDGPGAAEAVVCAGAAADALARESATLDLLICGATEHGPGGRLLGSTTRHLLREAACPLVIVPPGTQSFSGRA